MVMSTHFRNCTEADMMAVPDTGHVEVVTMSAAGEDYRAGLAADAVAEPRTYWSNTCPIRPGSSQDTARTPPLPVVEGRESQCLPGRLVRVPPASWDRWTKRQRYRTTASLQRILRWN